VRAHDVANGDDGEIEAPGHGGLRIDRSRSGRAHAAAKHVRANDEIALGIDRPAGSDHSFPPAGFLRYRMQVGDVLIAGERMANQHRVAALGIQRAVSLITDLKWSELDARIEGKRLIQAETDDERMRLVGFARAVSGIKCDSELGLDHRCDPAGDTAAASATA